jgi:hypothetical protein
LESQTIPSFLSQPLPPSRITGRREGNLRHKCVPAKTLGGGKMGWQLSERIIEEDEK